MGGAVKTQRIGHSWALASIICVVGGLTTAFAQEDAAGGTTLTFGVESTLSVTDNFNLEVVAPGTSTILDTVLSFGYLSETAVDRFAFDIDGVLRASDLPGAGGDFRFDDPGVALSYAREGANSRFSAEVNYNEANLDFIDPFEFIDDGILLNGSGVRETRSARLTFETGTSDPLGFIVELGHEAIDYRDTTDAGLFDSQTNDIALTTRLQLSPVLEGRVRLSQEDFSADDLVLTERTTRALSFGATYEISPVTTLDATLGFEKIDDSVTGEDTGAFGTIDLARALPNGSIGVTLDRSFGREGGRTTLSVNRDMELPSGTLAFSLGVTEGELGGTGIVGTIDYTQTLPQGELSASLERRVTNDTLGNDVLTTEAAVGYSMPTTAVSTLSFDFDYVEVEEVGTGTTLNSNRSTFRAAYTHELTADWDLSAGYEHEREFTEGSGTAKANTVFMTLGREFSIRR
jgi:hypothetical protein